MTNLHDVEDRSKFRWNHNTHFHRVVMDAVPAGASSALDVGTGDGLLAADLRLAIKDVTAVDIDPEVLARAAAEYSGITWICGDVMSVKLDRTFDVVASVATLHHLTDLSAAINRLADLTSPGGVMVVVSESSGFFSVEASLENHWSISFAPSYQPFARMIQGMCSILHGSPGSVR